MSNAENQGRFVWHDLMTTDVKAAGAYYPKFVAWKTQVWEQNSAYTLWVGARGPVGGVMSLPEEARSAGARSHWLAYISTADVDAGVQTAQRLGARVLKGATDIPTVGRFAVLSDPQGATFAMFSSSSPPPSAGGSPAGAEFSWHELATTDPEAAFRFYSELFGWQSAGRHDMGAMGFYYMFGQGGAPVGGMFKTPAGMPLSPNWLCYIQVDDAAKAAAAAKAAGGQLRNGPMQVPGGTWIAQLADPQGAAFAVHSDKSAAATPPPVKVQAVAKPAAAKPPAPKPAAPAVATTVKPSPAPAPKSAPVKAKGKAKSGVRKSAPKKAIRKKRVLAKPKRAAAAKRRVASKTKKAPKRTLKKTLRTMLKMMKKKVSARAKRPQRRKRR